MAVAVSTTTRADSAASRIAGGLLAAAVLALQDPALAERLDAWRAAKRDSIAEIPVDEPA